MAQLVAFCNKSKMFRLEHNCKTVKNMHMYLASSNCLGLLLNKVGVPTVTHWHYTQGAGYCTLHALKQFYTWLSIPVPICIYIYIYIYIYVYMYICIYIYVHIYVYIYIYCNTA